MKTTIKFLIITLITLFLFKSYNAKAQCNNDDWQALKALYDSTNGSGWDIRTGWDVHIAPHSNPPASCNLSDLFGISTENGRVTCIDLDGEDNCGWSATEGNNLVGNIPPELGNLSNLYFLRLTSNQLTGGIPAELQNLNNLSHLYLENNLLSGPLPPEIGDFTNLRYLWLGQNDFTGNIPDEIGNLTDLSQLYLDNNEFDGSIPSSIGDLTNLTYLTLGNNPLTGGIPSSIGNLNSLLSLEISNTNINNIPPEIGNLSNLEGLYLSNNSQLNGTIPSQLGNLSSLKVLILNYNSFIGGIPPEIGNLTDLEVFDVRSSGLSGEIPASFANLTKLRNLTFSSNSFEGNVLDMIANFPNLERFQSSNNQFSGTIPPSIGDLSQLKEFSIHGNDFSGVLPTEIGNLNQLTLFAIGENQLEGCYPNSLSNICPVITSHPLWYNGGNNFDAPIGDFCATGAGECPPGNPVWPGDLNYDFIVNNQDLSISHLFMGENGPHRAPGGITWSAQACDNWGKNQPNGYDIKHHDCDGNGNINTNDANAIIINNGKTHAAPSGFAPPQIPKYTNTDFQILLQPINQVSPNSNTIVMNVVMDSKSGQDLEVFGGHFSIDYSNIVNDVDTAYIDFENSSWLGVPFNNILAESWHNTFENTIEVGFTKTNGLPSTGKGIIGEAVFILNSNLNRSNNCETLLDVAITKIGSFNAQQDTLQIEEEFKTVNIGATCCEPFINIDDTTPFQNFYKSSGTIATNGYLPIGQNQQVQYNANRVTLNSGFNVKAGADFKVRNSGCN